MGKLYKRQLSTCLGAPCVLCLITYDRYLNILLYEASGSEQLQMKNVQFWCTCPVCIVASPKLIYQNQG